MEEIVRTTKEGGLICIIVRMGSKNIGTRLTVGGFYRWDGGVREIF